MKKLSSILVVPFIGLSLLTSCHSENKSATEFNNKIGRYNQQLTALGRRWALEFSTARSSGNYSPIQRITDSITKVIDGMTADLSSTPDVGGSEAFKKKELEYLGFEKEAMQSLAAPFRDRNDTAAEEQIGLIQGKVTETNRLEIQHLTELTQLQTDYAKRNGFRVTSAVQ